MSGETSDEGDCLRGLRLVVLLFAIIHTLFRGVLLMLDVLSTFAMLGPLLSENPVAFRHYLSEESKRVLWKGPYPLNSSLEETASSIANLTEVEDTIQLRVNLHLWSAHLLMQCVIFVFGWILIFSVKSKSYSGTLVWLAFSIPVFLQTLLHFILDLSFWDYVDRDIKLQITQGFDLVLQLVALILVACFLYQLYKKNAELRSIDRYTEQNGFPRNSGSVTIRRILDDEQF